MKKIFILIIAFIFGISLQMAAQPALMSGSEMPGIQQIITLYGEELNLTDEQKETLIGVSLDQRRELQRIRVRPERRLRSDRRGNRNTGRSTGERRELRERDEVEQTENQSNRNIRNRSVMIRHTDTYQKVYDVLDEEQTERLQSLLTEHINNQHSYRTLRYRRMVERAGIGEDQADQVMEIFEKQSQNRADLSILILQNPGEIDREQAREFHRGISEGNRQVKEILSASQYENLMREMSPMSRWQQPILRRSAPRSR